MHIVADQRQHDPVMEGLRVKHEAELKALEERLSSKRRNATKKNRKAIEDECLKLTHNLHDRHLQEASELACPGQLSETTEEREPPAFIPAHVSDTTEEQSSFQPAEGSVVDHASPQTGRTRKPNRQKARLARRAAEHEAAMVEAEVAAAKLPNLREQELQAMRLVAEKHDLVEHDIRPDGHCLYAAIADQLYIHPARSIEAAQPSEKLSHLDMRQTAATWIATHAEDFLPFLEIPLDEHVRQIRETGEWGGHLELTALAQAFTIKINILRSNGQIDEITASNDAQASLESRDALWLAYYQHSFGLGEHYNSLRPKPKVPT